MKEMILIRMHRVGAEIDRDTPIQPVIELLSSGDSTRTFLITGTGTAIAPWQKIEEFMLLKC